MRTTLLLSAAVLLGLLAGACSDDSRPAECEAIVEACHEVDTGSGEPHECHEGAESDWSKEMCIAMSADCMTACAAAAVDGGMDSLH